MTLKERVGIGEKAKNVEQGQLFIQQTFIRCFVDFKDNPYKNSVQLSDAEKKWESAEQEFVRIIDNAPNLTKTDILKWIANSAFHMVINAEAVENEANRPMNFDDINA